MTTPSQQHRTYTSVRPICAVMCASSQSMRAPEKWEALILRLVFSRIYASPKYSSEASCP